MTNFHEIQYGHNVTTDTPTSCIPKIGHDKLRLLLSCSDLGCQFCQCLCTLAQPRRYVQLQGCCGREQRYLFRLNTGHDCLAAHLYRIKVLSYNHCPICKQKKYNNGQSSPPPVPKTGSNIERTIKAVLGCQKTNGINPRSAIRPQQHFH